MIYIYGLCEPDLTVRYVGKAIHPIRRFHLHVSDVTNGPCRSKKALWLANLLLDSKAPRMIILDIASDDDWQEKEVAWIDKYKESGLLVNTAKGGASCERTLYYKRKTKPQPYIHTHAIGDVIRLETMDDMPNWLGICGDRIRKNMLLHEALRRHEVDADNGEVY